MQIQFSNCNFLFYYLNCRGMRQSYFSIWQHCIPLKNELERFKDVGHFVCSKFLYYHLKRKGKISLNLILMKRERNGVFVNFFVFFPSLLLTFSKTFQAEGSSLCTWLHAFLCSRMHAFDLEFPSRKEKVYVTNFVSQNIMVS